MDGYIPISMLNDFVFCPYSIYLHNVYMDADEGLYYSLYQVRGKMAHQTVDEKRVSSRKNVLQSLCICSDEYKLVGKIDLFRIDKRLLVERKYSLKQIFKGQIYQLWAQYFCMTEMGYSVEELAFYETSTNKMHYIPLPTANEKEEFLSFIKVVREYSPASQLNVNTNKCKYCIYCNLCDKTFVENVYS